MAIKTWPNRNDPSIYVSRKNTDRINRVNRRMDEYMKFKAELEESRRENELWDEEYGILCRLRSDAAVFEKAGDVDEAISSYNEAIEYAVSHQRMNNPCYYYHCYERLIILYRKTRQYKMEMDAIKSALSICNSTRAREWLQDRMTKTNLLIEKSKTEQQ